MQYLQKIQKTAGVFHILSMVAAGAAFIGAVTSLLGGILLVLHREPESGSLLALIMNEMHDTDAYTAGVKLITEAVFYLTDGLLFYFTGRYLQAELHEGTPFTENGARRIMRLGVKIIVLPLVALVIGEAIYASFEYFAPDTYHYSVMGMGEFDNGESILIGIMLLLLSMVFRYGAELEKNRKAETGAENMSDR